MTRTTDLNERLEAMICEALELGLPITSACNLVGVSHTSYYNWLHRGEAYKEALESGGDVDPGEEVFFSFLEATTRARSKCEATLLQEIREHAPKDWKAAAFVLERSFKNWGKKDQVDLTSGGEKIEGPVIYLPGRDEDE